MAIEYITWTARYENERYYSHPDRAMKAMWDGIVSFKPIGVCGTDGDKRQLAVIEYADDFTHVDRFINNYSDYSLVQISNDKALELAIEWCGEDSFTLVDGELVDHRILEGL